MKMTMPRQKNMGAGRPRRRMLAALLLATFLLPAGAATAQTDAFQGHAEDFGVQWKDMAEGRAAEGRIEAAPSRDAAFERALLAWREALGQAAGGDVRVRARGGPRWPQDLLVVLAAEDASGARLAGPTGFAVKKDGDRTVVLEVDARPWMPPPLLAASVGVVILYVPVLFLFFRAMARRLAQPHEESSWRGKQAVLVASSFVLLPVMVAFATGIYAAEGAGLWYTWMAFALGGGGEAFKSAFMLLFICFYGALCLGSYRAYIRQTRKYKDRFRKRPPKRRTFLQKASDPAVIQVAMAIMGQALFVVVLLKAQEKSIVCALLAGLAAIALVALASQAVMLAWMRRSAKRFLDADDPIVREALKSFAAVDGLEAARKIYVLPEEDWPLPNAFAAGLGRRRGMVGVTEPLLEACTPEEVVAVLLHEYGHFWERHTVFLTAAITCISAGCFVCFFAGPDWLRAAGIAYPFSMEHPMHTVLMLCMYLLGFVFLFPAVSRFFERRADRFPRDLGKGGAMASAMMKLREQTKAPLRWPRWLRWMSTHPSFAERLEFLRQQPPSPLPTQGAKEERETPDGI